MANENSVSEIKTALIKLDALISSLEHLGGNDDVAEAVKRLEEAATSLESARDELEPAKQG